jgi:hypothetical protein
MRVRAGDGQGSLRRFGAATATAASEGRGARAAPDRDAGKQASSPSQSLLRLLLILHLPMMSSRLFQTCQHVGLIACLSCSLCHRGVARTHERKGTVTAP